MKRRLFLIASAAALVSAPSLFTVAAWAQTATPSAVPGVDDIMTALTPRRRRGAPDPAVNAAIERIEALKVMRRTRGPSFREQDELHAAMKDLPQIEHEVQFDFNSAAINPASLPFLDNLAKALSSEALKAGSIVIAGHTDAKGSAAYNQGLSERRADAVAQYLIQTHKIDAGRFLTTGYGFRQLKVPGQPLDAKNRRVQIVNAAK